jgi:hypothetical protein
MDDTLPGPEFWAQVHSHTGDVTDVQRTVRGFMSDLTAVVESEKGPFFVKAVRNRLGGRLDSLLRERDINQYVRPISPDLLWFAGEGAWAVLGFEVVDGRFADFTPESGDLPVVVGLLDRIGRVELPGIARGWAETRWDRFAQGDAALFRGNSLLYTDINPSNFLIGDHGTWAVDWSWPTRGAAFIDPACLVLQLIAAGHTPESAEAWVADCPAWTGSDPKAVDAFAAASLRMSRQLADRKPDQTWLAAMADAAQAWVTHRSN